LDRGTNWWAQVSALTVAPETADPAAHVGNCEDLAGRLVQLAGALTLAQTLPGSCACGADACVFAGIPGGREACELIPLLAVASATPRGRRIPDSPEALRRAYIRTLRDAASAVSHCRRTQHVTGRCWFTPKGCPQDVCGRVLTVAHLLSSPAP